MTTMTYGQLVEAYVAVRDERDRLRDELDRLRSQLAEAREQRDQAAEALVRAEAERDAALQERDRWQQLAEERAKNLHATPHERGADPWTAEDWANWLRKRIQLAMDLVGHLLAPETAPKSPHSQDHTQVRGDRTEASAGADGPWSDAWCRTQLQRLSIAASEQYGLRWRDYDVVGAVIEELATLHARNREWEQTLGDLAARCDSGDIPIRLGERYSVAVLREIDRLRTEIDRLRAERDEALRAIALLEVEIRRIATVVGHHDGDQWHECTSERECMDALRRHAMPRIGGSDGQPA